MAQDPTDPIPRAGDDALAALLSGSVAAFGVPLEDAWRIEALSYLRSIADAAHLVLSLDLGDECDPAAVFRA